LKAKVENPSKQKHQASSQGRRSEVQEVEAALSEVSAKPLRLDNFNNFLRNLFQLENVLTESYAQNQTSHASNNFLFRKLKILAYINKKKTDQKWLVCYETNFKNLSL
jgi:hypothetical protein